MVRGRADEGGVSRRVGWWPSAARWTPASVPGGAEGALVVVGAGLLVVAGPFGRPEVVAGALVVGAEAVVVEVAPPVVAGSLVEGDVVAGAVVLGTDVDPGPVVGGTVSPAPVPSVVVGASVVGGTLLAEPSWSVSSTTSLAASGRPSSLMATTWYMRATPWGAAGSVKEVIWRSPSSATSSSW